MLESGGVVVRGIDLESQFAVLTQMGAHHIGMTVDVADTVEVFEPNAVDVAVFFTVLLDGFNHPGDAEFLEPSIGKGFFREGSHPELVVSGFEQTLSLVVVVVVFHIAIVFLYLFKDRAVVLALVEKFFVDFTLLVVCQSVPPVVSGFQIELDFSVEILQKIATVGSLLSVPSSEVSPPPIDDGDRGFLLHTTS